jgi:hypothetical protein
MNTRIIDSMSSGHALEKTITSQFINEHFRASVPKGNIGVVGPLAVVPVPSSDPLLPAVTAYPWYPLVSNHADGA